MPAPAPSRLSVSALLGLALVSAAARAGEPAAAPATAPAAETAGDPAAAPAEETTESAAATRTGPVTLGIPQVLSATETAAQATMLESYLTAALKQPVKTRAFADYEQLSSALAKGEVDLAWITPLAYVKAAEGTGVFPLAKALRKGLDYRSVIFVRQESKARTLADLKGSRVAWVNTSSAAGYLFPRAMLVKEKLRPTGFFAAETFAGDHKGVCQAVLTGKADAGATFANGSGEGEAFKPDGCGETLGSDVLGRLRVVAASDRIPNEVVAARVGFDEQTAAQVASVLALMPETEAGARILKTIFRADGFGLALEPDFDPVRSALASVESGTWVDPRQYETWRRQRTAEAESRAAAAAAAEQERAKAKKGGKPAARGAEKATTTEKATAKGAKAKKAAGKSK